MPAPAPPAPPSRLRLPWWGWLLVAMGVVGALALTTVLASVTLVGCWTAKNGPELVKLPTAVAEAPRLESRYSGELTWEGKTVRITWRDNGTRDNDGDHALVLIEGPDLRLEAVWGWMDSGLGRVGKPAEIFSAEVPPGWPRPRRLVIDQPLATGGWSGKMEADRGPMLIKLERP